jgi:hypothetical protein
MLEEALQAIGEGLARPHHFWASSSSSPCSPGAGSLRESSVAGSSRGWRR